MATKKNEAAAPELNLEDIQKQIAEMLAAAEAKANEIVAKAEEAAKKIDPMGDADISAMKEADRARGEELVEVMLFKDGGKYKDDVFVSVNGETIAIKRGVRVKIKRKFAEVLEASMQQDQETASLIDLKSSEYDAAVAAQKL